MSLTLLLIILLSFIGLGIAVYTYQKREKGALYEGPEADDQDPLMHVRHSLFLKVPVEFVAMGYFGVVGLIYTGLKFAGATVPGLDYTALMLSGIALLLFLYEILMRLFAIKQLCLWCMASLALGVAVFLLVLRSLEVELVPLLVDAQEYSLTVHLLGVVLGLGGTTVVDVMFFHFLRNYKITPQEAVIMHLLSQMIILGLTLLIVSGFALFYTDQEGYLASGRFLMKMTAVLVATINGGFLNFYITPKMKQISFVGGDNMDQHKNFKRIAFATGAISIVSWYSAFFLAMIKVLEVFSYTTLFIGYLVLLAIGIGASQVTKLRFKAKAAEAENLDV
jgi:uncharacterized membrane protein